MQRTQNPRRISNLTLVILLAVGVFVVIWVASVYSAGAMIREQKRQMERRSSIGNDSPPPQQVRPDPALSRPDYPWEDYVADSRYAQLTVPQRLRLLDSWKADWVVDQQQKGLDVDKEYLASIRERVISGADVASVVSVKTAQPRPLREATREWEEDWARFEEDLDRTRERHRVEAETSRREYEAERQRRQLDALNSHLEEMNRRERERELRTPGFRGS